jgi:hypothetical protein
MMRMMMLLLTILPGNKVCTQSSGWGNAGFLAGQGHECRIVRWGP